MQAECNIKSGKHGFTRLDTAEPQHILYKDMKKKLSCNEKTVFLLSHPSFFTVAVILPVGHDDVVCQMNPHHFAGFLQSLCQPVVVGARSGVVARMVVAQGYDTVALCSIASRMMMRMSTAVSLMPPCETHSSLMSLKFWFMSRTHASSTSRSCIRVSICA